MPIAAQSSSVPSKFLSEFTTLLVGVCEMNEKKRRVQSKSVFDCKTGIPSLPVYQYLMRLVKGARGSAELFVAVLIYINRLDKCAGIDLTSRNCHRLILTTFIIAAKANEDFVFSNTYYAQVGGVSLEDLNEMEVFFLNSVDWNVSTTVEYPLYAEKLLTGCELKRIC